MAFSELGILTCEFVVMVFLIEFLLTGKGFNHLIKQRKVISSLCCSLKVFLELG